MLRTETQPIYIFCLRQGLKGLCPQTKTFKVLCFGTKGTKCDLQQEAGAQKVGWLWASESCRDRTGAHVGLETQREPVAALGTRLPGGHQQRWK